MFIACLGEILGTTRHVLVAVLGLRNYSLRSPKKIALRIFPDMLNLT